MANLKLDNTLAGALSTIVERYKDDNQFVSVENADKLVFDELERMGYLKNLSYDFSGNAIMIPTYKAAAYFQEENGAAIVASRNNKVFETFEETYTRVKGIGNGGAGNVYEVAASDGERYALKLLNAEAARNPSKLKRFLQEARYELEGKCSAVVKAVDLGSIGSGNEKRPFYVMPLMDGSLDGLMKRAGGFLQVRWLRWSWLSWTSLGPSTVMGTSTGISSPKISFTMPRPIACCSPTSASHILRRAILARLSRLSRLTGWRTFNTPLPSSA